MVVDGMMLTDRYTELCETESDIFLHLPRFVDMVVELDAQHVVELGSRSGVSTVAWLHGLARTGGRLTSVDLDGAPDIGVHGNWRHIVGDDLDPAVVQACSVPAPDIVFIDTSHHYTQTCRELAVYRWVVKPGGLLVCHDTMLARPEGAPAGDGLYPVRRAIEGFVAENGFQWVNIPECWGLGVIKVGD